MWKTSGGENCTSKKSSKKVIVKFNILEGKKEEEKVQDEDGEAPKKPERLEVIEGPKLDDTVLVRVLEEINRHNIEIDQRISSDIKEFLEKNPNFTIS